MSIRCHACRGRHDSIQQIKVCSANQAGQTRCKHDLDIGQCVTCAAWNTRRGVRIVASTYPGPEWIQDLFEDSLASGICSLCSDALLLGQQIAVRVGFRNWAHEECFVDPGRVLEPEPQKSQREPKNPYNEVYDRTAALQLLAEQALPEAIAIEEETDFRLLKQVAADMEYELSIDLIRETIYGYSLEMLGAFEEKEASPWEDLDEEIERLEADSLVAWAEQYQL